ncbi:hypothetical protein TNCV_441581 [Trichonephila clavipes]|nr:hypothetical protein TNCV_441581 [Trichonephila clavipes]
MSLSLEPLKTSLQRWMMHAKSVVAQASTYWYGSLERESQLSRANKSCDTQCSKNYSVGAVTELFATVNRATRLAELVVCFDSSVECYIKKITGEARLIEEVANLSESMNSYSHAEIDNETPVKCYIFKCFTLTGN